MTAEAWGAVIGAASLLAFVVTAVAAIVQLRHLRMANSLNGLITILQDWQKPEMQQWVDFIRFELPERLKDEAFVNQLRTPPIMRSAHPELNICDYYEQVGSYVKYKMIDQTAYLDVSSTAVVGFWTQLWPAISVIRESRKSEAIYENFEYLAVISRNWNDGHSNGTYPSGVPRWRDITPQ